MVTVTNPWAKLSRNDVLSMTSLGDLAGEGGGRRGDRAASRVDAIDGAVHLVGDEDGIATHSETAGPA